MEVPVLPGLGISATLEGLGEDSALALLMGPDEAEVHPDVARSYGLDLTAVARATGVGPAGTSHVICLPPLLAADPWAGRPRTLVLVGIGDGETNLIRAAGLAAGRAARGRSHLGVLPGPLDAARTAALAEGLLLAGYRVPRRSGPADAAPDITIQGEPTDLSVVLAAVWGTYLARTLAAVPSDIKSPAWLADRAVALVAAEEDPRLAVEVHDEAWLAANGLGAVLAVGRGSGTPPRLVTVRYDGAPGAPVVLVGKGVTFDTGGISLKPREAMVPMKTDMSGAAVVLATVLAAARAGLPVHVVGVLPLAENALGAAAWRPGDVVATHAGTSVEILNTDAEGRLVLADAMSWARGVHRPRVLVDVATLTGAATLGLGRGHAALFASDEDLGAALADSGSRVGEEFWPMPLVEDYRDALRSPVADLANVARDERVQAGAVVAALFLRTFAGDTPWAHLDIAGPGRTGSATPELGAHAPTGFGVRALVDWLAR